MTVLTRLTQTVLLGTRLPWQTPQSERTDCRAEGHGSHLSGTGLTRTVPRKTTVRPPSRAGLSAAPARTNPYEPRHNQPQEIYATAVYAVHSTPYAAQYAAHRPQDRFYGRPLPCFT